MILEVRTWLMKRYCCEKFGILDEDENTWLIFFFFLSHLGNDEAHTLNVSDAQ